MRIYACNYIGPQNGEPLCPCQMRNVIERDGRYIKREQDLGPVTTPVVTPIPSGVTQGCICPVGAEKTCQGPLCPRRPIGPVTSIVRNDGCYND